MMKKWLIEIACVAVMALAVAPACAQQQTPASSTPAVPSQSSPTPKADEPPLPSATPAAKPHQPSPAETAVAQFSPTNDPKEIVRRATEVDHHNFERAQKYTCTQREIIKHLDKHGNVKSTEIKTFDINFYFGE